MHIIKHIAKKVNTDFAPQALPRAKGTNPAAAEIVPFQAQHNNMLRRKVR